MGCGQRVILDSLSLSFPDRRVTCIVGPGGSGKSTLLNVLARGGEVEAPLWSHGAVRVAGRAALSPQRRDVAPTIRGLLAAAAPRRSANALVERAWSAVSEARDLLLRVLDVPLPGVPRDVRRLADLTPALASRADLLLLDEPDAGATACTLEWTMTQLAELKRRRTLIIATHHLRMARAVADEVLLLLDGAVIEHAPVEAFFERPATPRAATYVLMGS